jgi:hypothetical protein
MPCVFAVLFCLLICCFIVTWYGNNTFDEDLYLAFLSYFIHLWISNPLHYLYFIIFYMSDENKTKERSLVCSSFPLFLALLSRVLLVKCWQVSKFSYPRKILADMHQWITISSCDQSIIHEHPLFVTEVRRATQQCIAKNFMRRKNLLIKCTHKFCNWPCRNIYDGITCSFSWWVTLDIICVM